ncbi:YtxH domain-containing protein [Neobacillus pocheonensis]|uniref:YtxH domain-containing protein n=1 Tax=Neobacillus pocheonensis TaxID=363869 RepID=A0ABT0WCT4_9BACI|nr:YtxH domain-containing protein [Neobacillus pocheonensis]
MTLKNEQDDLSKETGEIEKVKVAQVLLVVGMGIVAIATAGVTTGVLIAQKSGKETRKDLKKKAVNTVETIKDTIQKNAETVKDARAHAEEKVNDVIGKRLDEFCEAERINKSDVIHLVLADLLEKYEK